MISGYHMVFTWYRELGLAIEKHSTTTSDLKGRHGRGYFNSGRTRIHAAGLTNAEISIISPAVCKTPVLMMVSESIPEAKGHTDIIHHISGAL